MFGAAGATPPRRFVSYQLYSTAASASFSKDFLMISSTLYRADRRLRRR
jgi:hypothetical protein